MKNIKEFKSFELKKTNLVKGGEGVPVKPPVYCDDKKEWVSLPLNPGDEVIDNIEVTCLTTHF